MTVLEQRALRVARDRAREFLAVDARAAAVELIVTRLHRMVGLPVPAGVAK